MKNKMDEKFESLIIQNHKKIKRITRAYSHGIEEWKDLQQEVMYNIWKSLYSFRAESDLGTWIYRITLNVCLQHSLKRKKEATVPLEGFHNLAGDSLHQDIEKAEILKHLYKCISQLPDPEKTLVLLYLEELPYKEISQITGILENTVAVKLSRIKKKLFECLKVE